MRVSEDQAKEFFFFLIVDDGGFSRTFPDDRGGFIDFSAYENLVRLAENFDTQIVIACTGKFLDIHRVSESPAPHRDSARLISLLESRSDRLIVADHGYDHQFAESYCEFYDYARGIRRASAEQEKHIEQNISIYRSLQWKPPELFVAPAHGWEPGVTDRLYAERGVKYLSSYLWIKHAFTGFSDMLFSGWRWFFKPEMEYPETSMHLKILPRLGLGLPSNSDSISRLQWFKAQHSVVPTGRVRARLLHRRIVRQPHNYAVHVANFAGDNNYRNWCTLFGRIMQDKAYIPKTFEESIRLWQNKR